jgi:hypothetical protein
LDRRFQATEIRRAFTVFQLMTILEEARNSLIVIEHDPLLYSPGTDTFLEDMTRNADRVFYFDEGPRATTKLISKAYPKAQKSQTTLETWT